MFPVDEGLRASLLNTGPPEKGGGALKDFEGEIAPGLGWNPLEKKLA